VFDPWLSRYIKHEFFKKKAIKKLPPFLDAWSDFSSPSFIFSPAQKRNFSLPHLCECCWYLECKRTWQPDEEAELKIRLSSGEPPLPPTQSDEVVLLDSQLPAADKVVATFDETNTQKSKRRKRATQDESSLKKRTRNQKIVEDDPPPPAPSEATVASLQLLVNYLLSLGRIHRPFFHLPNILRLFQNGS